MDLHKSCCPLLSNILRFFEISITAQLPISWLKEDIRIQLCTLITFSTLSKTHDVLKKKNSELLKLFSVGGLVVNQCMNDLPGLLLQLLKQTF